MFYDKYCLKLFRNNSQIYVICSSSVIKYNACSLVVPHTSIVAEKSLHTLGLDSSPNNLHKLFSSSWIQRSPAALPFGIPGMGELILGAIQQAPQPNLHAILSVITYLFKNLYRVFVICVMVCYIFKRLVNTLLRMLSLTNFKFNHYRQPWGNIPWLVKNKSFSLLPF